MLRDQVAHTRQPIAGAGAQQVHVNRAHQSRARIDQTRINLNQGSASAQLFQRIGRGENAADADNRQLPVGQPRQTADHGGGTCAQGRAASAAGQAGGLGDVVAAGGGVGHDQTICASAADGGEHIVGFGLGQIGRDFDQQRQAWPQAIAQRDQRPEQRFQHGARLELAQSLGVGAADVDGHILRLATGVDSPQQGGVVIHGFV